MTDYATLVARVVGQLDAGTSIDSVNIAEAVGVEDGMIAKIKARAVTTTEDGKLAAFQYATNLAYFHRRPQEHGGSFRVDTWATAEHTAAIVETPMSMRTQAPRGADARQIAEAKTQWERGDALHKATHAAVNGLDKPVFTCFDKEVLQGYQTAGMPDGILQISFPKEYTADDATDSEVGVVRWAKAKWSAPLDDTWQNIDLNGVTIARWKGSMAYMLCSAFSKSAFTEDCADAIAKQAELVGHAAKAMLGEATEAEGEPSEENIADYNTVIDLIAAAKAGNGDYERRITEMRRNIEDLVRESEGYLNSYTRLLAQLDDSREKVAEWGRMVEDGAAGYLRDVIGQVAAIQALEPVKSAVLGRGGARGDQTAIIVEMHPVVIESNEKKWNEYNMPGNLANHVKAHRQPAAKLLLDRIKFHLIIGQGDKYGAIWMPKQENDGKVYKTDRSAPHMQGNGTPCLGTAGPEVAQALTKRDFVGVMQWLIPWCGSCRANDHVCAPYQFPAAPDDMPLGWIVPGKDPATADAMMVEAVAV